MYELKHEFIADGDAQYMVRAVRVDRGHNVLLLVRVFNASVVRKVVVSQEDGQIHFRLLDRLKLRANECPIRLGP